MRFLLAMIGWGVTGVVVVGGVLVALSLVGTPRPACADGNIVSSRTAEDSFNTKWNAFDAAIKRGEAATVTFTEEELTSRGARYLADTNVPARNLQVHLCPGQGKGEATLSLEVMGLNVDALVAGHLELGSSPPRIVVDSLQLGQVPGQIAALAANRLLEAANITVSPEIRQVATTSTAATLQGRR